MSINKTYKKILLQEYFTNKLKQGDIPSYESIRSVLDSYNSSSDLSSPQFSADDFKITDSNKESSSSLQNNMINTLFGDLSVLYQELKRLTEASIENYERWGHELKAIEKSLFDLEGRVGDLALLAEDSEGYINFVADRFSDLSLVDQTLSSGLLFAPHINTVTLKPSSHSLQPISLNLTDTDVSFKVVSRSGGTTRQAEGSSVLNAFSDLDTFWLTQVQANRQEVITGELKVKLSDSPIDVSRIEFIAHSSNGTSAMTITPLYSTDGYTFKQLPGNLITQSVVDTGVFVFEQTSMTYVKFLISKQSSDFVSGNKLIYEFGASLIQFFNDGFTVTTNMNPRPRLISKPLSVLDQNTAEPIEFSKASLEVCENLQDGTNLSYFLTVGNDSSLEITDNTSWVSIDPFSRKDKESAHLVDLGDLSLVTLGDPDETSNLLKPSYNASATESQISQGLKNPGVSFYLVKNDSGSVSAELIEEADILNSRYTFLNNNDRILNYQLRCPKDSRVIDSSSAYYDSSYFGVDENSFIIYRNIGQMGQSYSDRNSFVRGIQAGWGFSDPYYYCTVYVDNIDGLQLDVGDSPMWVDDEAKSGKQVLLTYGHHNIRVHKDNWIYVEPGKSTLSSLKEADPLYPYNHKLLIEGYSYDANFDEPDEEIYTGVDIFAQHKMKKVKIFDFINQVKPDDYSRFAIDYDLPNSYNLPEGGSNTYGNMVFLVKVDPNSADSVNEAFMIKFKMVDQKYKYLRLRADFETSSVKLTPVLNSYKIKIG
ncbi:hypothetical protein GF373_17425 [bacterium]|nr:hypothetical protein [bacterium]